MKYNPKDAQAVLNTLLSNIKTGEDPNQILNKLLFGMMVLRARGVTNGIRNIVGSKVFAGPFKGTLLTDEAIAPYSTPVLLGCYEHELHPAFEKVIATNYTRVLNIGCSVGYYAVGLARCMPQAIIEAFDIDPEARRKCAEMAQVNGVQDRIRISGEFRGEDFAAYDGQKTLVLMDIEGAEKDLLDPTKYPALQKMDVIVELHDLADPTISKTACDRFAATHSVEIIRNSAILPDVSGLLPPTQYLEPFDHFLLGWECRGGPTPWGIFWTKHQ